MAEIVCLPIEETRGLLSPVSSHFGRAAWFLLVDMATLAHRSVANAPVEGRCDPYRALAGHAVDTFIVGGIGPRALEEIDRRRIPVYLAPGSGVADALAGYIAGRLPRVREPTRAGADAAADPRRA